MKNRNRTLLRAGLCVVVALVGTTLGWRVWGGAQEEIGPFRVGLKPRLQLGRTTLELPPIGAVSAQTHQGPLSVNATLQQVDLQQLRELAASGRLDDLTKTGASEWQRLRRELAIGMVTSGAVATLLLALALFRARWRLVLAATLISASVIAAGGWRAATSYDLTRFEHPSYSGSLAEASKLIGALRTVPQRIDAVSAELEQLIEGVSSVYLATEPRAACEDTRLICLLHISDIHSSPLGMKYAKEIAQSWQVDLVLDTGDLTSYGLPVENLIIQGVEDFDVPYVYVQGNHDSDALATKLAAAEGVTVLDGVASEIAGLTIYGKSHPVFTEDNSEDIDPGELAAGATEAAALIAQDLQELTTQPDIVAVHDIHMLESVAADLLPPLILAGHTHETAQELLGDSLVLTVGTTSGSGLNLFSDSRHETLSAQILYFDPQGNLIDGEQFEKAPFDSSLKITPLPLTELRDDIEAKK